MIVGEENVRLPSAAVGACPSQVLETPPLLEFADALLLLGVLASRTNQRNSDGADKRSDERLT